MTNVSYHDQTASAAERYERDFVPAIGTPVARLTVAAAGVGAGDRLLDVACGTGVVARLAVERTGTSAAAGIDLTPEMIDVARSVAPTIDWQVADAGELPYDDESFDVVTCQLGLMFMADRAGAVAEMARVLAPGGRIAVTTAGSVQPLFQVMEDALAEHIGPEVGQFVGAVFSMHDPAAVAELLHDAGFHDVEGSVESVTLQLPGPRDFLWQYIDLTPMGAFVAQAAPEARQALERDVVAGWQRFVVDDRMPMDQPIVVATGRR